MVNLVVRPCRRGFRFIIITSLVFWEWVLVFDQSWVNAKERFFGFK
jgi:hypothetical protein